jgi:hypothetical protein
VSESLTASSAAARPAERESVAANSVEFRDERGKLEGSLSREKDLTRIVELIDA